jgi:hypothetical protein
LNSERMNASNTQKTLWFTAFLMIIAAGGRDWVGADYPVYRSMYNFGFPNFTTYEDVWNKATFQPNTMDIEWFYVLVNKILFDFRMSFHVLTFLLAIASISMQVSTFHKYSALPVLSMIFYFMPIYFITDCGQMRQGIGTAICIFSIRYIVERKVWKFLLCIFFALGMHKSTIIFLPAYWIAALPINGVRWIPIIVTCMILAPFKAYALFGGLIESIAPQEISDSYTGYSADKYYGNELETGLGDVINLFLIILIILYDKKGEKKIYYFEYFRNLALFGYCLYYIFRGNAIFATRLPGVYMAFSGYFAIPGIMMAMKKEIFRVLKLGFIVYFLLLCYAFSKVNAVKGSFTKDKYHNILW